MPKYHLVSVTAGRETATTCGVPKTIHTTLEAESPQKAIAKWYGIPEEEFDTIPDLEKESMVEEVWVDHGDEGSCWIFAV